MPMTTTSSPRWCARRSASFRPASWRSRNRICSSGCSRRTTPALASLQTPGPTQVGLDGGSKMSEKLERPTDSAYGGATVVPPKKLTVPDLVAMKRDAKRITMMTAYDAAFARLVDQAGVDVILVGDSLGMVVLGYPTTVPVTMDDMVRHAAAVSRGAKRALLVGDMPFGSYQASSTDALHNAARFLKEAGMDAIKVEGGHEVVETDRTLTANGIAVMAHVGLTPQRVAQLGGFKVQAKTARAARRLIDDALALEDAGAFSIVLASVTAA